MTATCVRPLPILLELSLLLSLMATLMAFFLRAKSLIYTPSTCSVSHPLLRDIPTTIEGFTLLGFPIGPPTFCESTVSVCVDKIRAIISNLSDLQDAQMGTALLQTCLPLPKLAFILLTLMLIMRLCAAVILTEFTATTPLDM